MAYSPDERKQRMKELMRPIEMQIMMCDDVQDLFALASIMMVTSKNIFKEQLGVKPTVDLLLAVVEDLYNDNRRER